MELDLQRDLAYFLVPSFDRDESGRRARGRNNVDADGAVDSTFDHLGWHLLFLVLSPVFVLLWHRLLTKISVVELLHPFQRMLILVASMLESVLGKYYDG